MKYIKYLQISIIALLCTYTSSCGKMEDTYSEFIVNRTYTGKADSIKIRSGRNRVELSWLLLSDPKIDSYKVLWNNGQDSKTDNIVRTDNVDTVTIILDNLKEDIHFFEIFHYDKLGNPSVRATIVGRAYGERYENTLLNRLFTYKRSLNNLDMTWAAPDETMLYVDLKYINTEGDEINQTIDNETNKITLQQFPSNGTLIYRTAYLPDSLALDIFYSRTDTLAIDL